ncbi:MAG: amidohydrolase [Pseudomonadales bacterium]|nr:amidohydrolase [Pseudomonadales bacterium]
MNIKKILLSLVVLVIATVVAIALMIRPPQPPAHQVFINGNVLTMDGSNRIVEAVSVIGELIEATGSTEEIKKLITDETLVTDLQGRTLMPGFIDAHGHFPGSALTVVNADLNSPPIGNKKNMADVMAALRAQAEKTPEGEWVVALGYDDTLLAEKRHPTRAELDQVSDKHPIVAMHISGHMSVSNSMALAAINIDADTPNPEGGVIGRREGSNEPNGLLQETAQQELMGYVFDVGLAKSYQIIKIAAAEYASVGVTTAQSGGVSPALAKGIALFIKLGIIPMRVVLFPMETEYDTSLLNGEYDPATYSNERLTMGPIKLVADGSIQGYTGYLSRPYHVPYKGDETYNGYPSIDKETLIRKVTALHKAGYQLAIHANGDQSVEDVLDAFEIAQKAHPVDDPRLILIHSQMARKDQIERMKGLGVTPSFFSAHTWYWGDRHRDIFMGPERAADMSPAKWAQDNELRYSTHMDTPVTPMLPLQAVWSTVHRITVGGQVLGEDQRVGAMQALRAVTIDAAWQVFQENNRGSLEPGKYADMVILSGSPLENPMAMRDLKVEKTFVGGVTIYQNNQSGPDLHQGPSNQSIAN